MKLFISMFIFLFTLSLTVPAWAGGGCCGTKSDSHSKETAKGEKAPEGESSESKV